MVSVVQCGDFRTYAGTTQHSHSMVPYILHLRYLNLCMYLASLISTRMYDPSENHPFNVQLLPFPIPKIPRYLPVDSKRKRKRKKKKKYKRPPNPYIRLGNGPLLEYPCRLLEGMGSGPETSGCLGAAAAAAAAAVGCKG